jgi:hypothetical protein
LHKRQQAEKTVADDYQERPIDGERNFIVLATPVVGGERLSDILSGWPPPATWELALIGKPVPPTPEAYKAHGHLLPRPNRVSTWFTPVRNRAEKGFYPYSAILFSPLSLAAFYVTGKHCGCATASRRPT